MMESDEDDGPPPLAGNGTPNNSGSESEEKVMADKKRAKENGFDVGDTDSDEWSDIDPDDFVISR